jgi:hypothetical protein
VIDFELPMSAPKGYSYEYEIFNSRLISIWLRHHKIYDYNLGKSVRSIWGFYSLKKKEYYAPINSLKPGKSVLIENTTSYTAMPISRTLLEKCFV